MNSNKIENIETTIPISMELINKNTQEVISTSGTSMTVKSSQYIFFTINHLMTSGESLTSYKLKFLQVGSSDANMILYKSNSAKMITSSGYKMICSTEGLNTYRIVDITDAIINSKGETLYFAIVCENSTGIGLYTSSATPNFRRPKEIIKKVKNNDFVKNQHYLSGQTRDNDQYNINIRTGKFSYSMNLVSTYAEYLPTNLNVIYNPEYHKEVFETGLPKGWKFNYFQKVISNGSTYTYIDGQFKKHTFVLADNLTSSSAVKVYYENDGNYLTLKINTGNTSQYYEINDEGVNTLYFNNLGNLTKIVNKVDSNVEYLTTLTYDSNNRLTKITDGSSLNTLISYNDTSRVITITKPNGQTILLKYDINKLMTSIEFENNDVTAFEHATTNSLTRAIDPSMGTYILNKVRTKNKQLTLQYITNTKVVEKYKEEFIDNENESVQVNKSYILSYSQLQTLVECHPFSEYLSNNQSTYFKYTFDENGETVAINEMSSLGEILSSRLFRRTQAGTSSINPNTAPYLYNNTCYELPATRGQLEVYDDEFESAIDIGNGFETNQQYNVIIEYSLSKNDTMQVSTTNELSVEAKEGDQTLAKIYLNQENGFKQEAFLTYDSKLTSAPDLVFKNTNPNFTLNILSISIFIGGYSNPKLITTLNVDNESTTIDTTTYYDARPFNIECVSEGTTLTKTNIEQSYQDFVRNKENYFKIKKINGNNSNVKYNVWYNDGQNMLYNVSTVNYVYNDSRCLVENLEVVNFNGNKLFHTGNLIRYDFINNKRYMIEYNMAKNYVDFTKFTTKEVNDYGFVLNETDENGLTIEYTYSQGMLTRQNINNNNTVYQNINNDRDLITDFTYLSNRKESVKNYYQSHIVGVKNTYDVMGNIKNTYDINDTQTPLTKYEYGENNELLNKITFDKTSNDEETTLTYDDNKISTLNHSGNPIYQFLYDFRDDIKEIKISGNTICTMNYVYSPSQISKTINYATGEKERLTYNKYGKLIKLERAASGSDFQVLFTATYKSYDKTHNEIESSNNSYTKISYADGGYSETFKNPDGNLYTIEYLENEYEILVNSRNGSGIHDGLERSYSSTEINVSLDYNDLFKETQYVTSVDESKATQIFKTITLYDDNHNETHFVESLIQEKLRRSNKSSVNFHGINFLNQHEYASSSVGTSNFISKDTFTIKISNVAVNKELFYEYDKKGNVKSITGDGTISYIYDSYNRLIRENNTNFNASFIYEYDIYGNIISKKKYAYKNYDESLGSLQETKTYSYNSNNKTLLTNYDGTSVTYDAMNRPTSLLNKTLTWSFGKLMNYGNVSFKYLPNGKRVRKEQGNKCVCYAYDGDRLIREIRHNYNTNNSTMSTTTYIYGSNGLIGFRYKTNNTYTDYFYRKNIFGDIIEIYYNDNGESKVIAKYIYDAWGNHKVLLSNGDIDTDPTSIGNINPFRYRGYYYDVETQLFYCNSRYYSPELCRFISPDNIEYLDPQSINGLNLYCYCKNNPIMYYDPSGHMPEWLSTTLKIIGGVAIIAGCVVGSIFTGGALSVLLAGAAIGAAAGGIGAGISTAVSGGDIHDFGNAFLMGTATGAISGAAAASPLGMGAQMGINAFLGAVNYYGNQKLSGGKITLGGLVINAGIGAICGLIGKGGWMQDIPAALFAGTSVKNALKYVGVLAGKEALLRMTLPSFIIGGLGGGIYGRINEQHNPFGDFVGI